MFFLWSVDVVNSIHWVPHIKPNVCSCIWISVAALSFLYLWKLPPSRRADKALWPVAAHLAGGVSRAREASPPVFGLLHLTLVNTPFALLYSVNPCVMLGGPVRVAPQSRWPPSKDPQEGSRSGCGMPGRGNGAEGPRWGRTLACPGLFTGSHCSLRCTSLGYLISVMPRLQSKFLT